jgi:hypothetical protein
MALIRYQRAAVLVDSVLQAQVHDVTINWDSKAQVVETLLQGFSGITPGAKFVEVDAMWALPTSGMEFDVASAIANLDIHTVQMPLGTKTQVATGFFISGSMKGAVNANTDVSAKFIGTYDPPS